MNGRITALDGLRGVGVMGILLMNVVAFAMPFAAYTNPAAFGGMAPADLVVWAIELVLIDGKMRAIFSALFGASLLLVVERAEAAGRSGARIHYARMATLLLFGLVHACLIWEGDILTLYALIGMIAFAARRLPVERLLILAGMLFIFQAAFLALHYQALALLQAAATAPGAPPADIATWRLVLDEIGRPRPLTLALDLARHADWRALTASRIAAEPGAILAQLEFDGPETLGLMLLGMAGLKSGFLRGAWSRAAYGRVGRLAYLIGLPPMIAIALWLIARDFPPVATACLTDLVAMPFRWIVAIGHAALLVRWFVGSGSGLARRVAAAGRAAFSNYLGTSLVMTGLFDGLGLYGRLERWMLLPIALATCGVMLVWSKPWLDRFAFGPLEWLWRALARGSVPPLRRKDIAS